MIVYSKLHQTLTWVIFGVIALLISPHVYDFLYTHWFYAALGLGYLATSIVLGSLMGQCLRSARKAQV